MRDHLGEGDPAPGMSYIPSISVLSGKVHGVLLWALKRGPPVYPFYLEVPNPNETSTYNLLRGLRALISWGKKPKEPNTP